MKKITFLIVIMMLAIVDVRGQKVVSVEGTETSNVCPISNEKCNFSQFIYLHSEIAKGEITIKSLTFKINNTPDNISGADKWEVSLAQTSKNQFEVKGGNTSAFTGVTKVFDGTVTYDKSTGTVKIILNSDYVLPKDKNLVVEVYEKRSGSVGELKFSHKQGTYGVSRSIYYNVGSDYPIDTFRGLSYGYNKRMDTYPAVTIGYSSSKTDDTTTQTPKPTEFSYCVGDDIVLDAQVTDSKKGAVYTYEWKLEGVVDSANKKNILETEATADLDGKTYEVKVADSNSPNCFTIQKITLKINEKPEFKGIEAENESLCGGKDDLPTFIVKGTEGATVTYYIDNNKTDLKTIKITKEQGEAINENVPVAKIVLDAIDKGTKTVTVVSLEKGCKLIIADNVTNKEATTTVVKPKALIKRIK